MFIEFGEPQSVLNTDILDYCETYLEDGLFEPPIALDGLAKSLRANGTHASALYAKRNILCSVFEITDTTILSKKTLSKYIFDELVFGNAFLLSVKNKLGQAVSLKHLPSLYMRRQEKQDCYAWKTEQQTILYKQDSVYHGLEYDVTQEIYGVPQYLASLSSIWLSEDATLFRRKYYKNGAHSGFLLYVNNPNLTDEMEKEIKSSLNSAKGLGNFKNWFINGKGKDNEKPELIPVGQINTKDEFYNIKKVTTEEILTAHRIPLDLMSVVREGLSSGGDLNKIDAIFYKNEILPLAEKLLDINEFLGKKILKIKPYVSISELLTPP